MNYRQVIEDALEERGGVITTEFLAEHNIPTVYLTRLVRSGRLARIGRGVYATDRGEYDELALFQHRYKKAVFSFETALHLHGLTDKIPQVHHVSVPAHYKFNARPAGIVVHYVKADLLQLGIARVSTIFGNLVTATNPERTICDIIRHKDSIEPEMYGQALRTYAREGDMNRLREMAVVMKMTEKVRTVMEVLL